MGIDVLVIQHGDKVGSAGDPGLTALGQRQAATVATWLAKNRRDVAGIWTSPLRRARETATEISAATGIEVRVDDRLRERMNWDDTTISHADFLAEWRRASHDSSYRPTIGDSARGAAARFIAAVVDFAHLAPTGAVVVVSHGGVTVDALRAILGDDAVRAADPSLIDAGVPCCAITTLTVDDGIVTVTDLPSTRHLDDRDRDRPLS